MNKLFEGFLGLSSESSVRPLTSGRAGSILGDRLQTSLIIGWRRGVSGINVASR